MTDAIREIFVRYPVFQDLPQYWFFYSAIILVALILLTLVIGCAVITAGIELTCRNVVANRRNFFNAGFISVMRFIISHWWNLIHKRYTIPSHADKPVYIFAPVLLFAVLFFMYALLPVTGEIRVVNPDTGLIFFLAMFIMGGISIFLGGMASADFEAETGSIRYLLSLMFYLTISGLALVPAVMASGTLNLTEIVRYQEGGIAGWMILQYFPFNAISFAVFITASLIPIAFNPFSGSFVRFEVSGGPIKEYGGVLLFFFVFARYALLFLTSSFAILIFWGGWSSPMEADAVYSSIWLFPKVLLLIAFVCWIHRFVPPLRLDQIMHASWKILFISAIISITGAGCYLFIEK